MKKIIASAGRKIRSLARAGIGKQKHSHDRSEQTPEGERLADEASANSVETAPSAEPQPAATEPLAERQETEAARPPRRRKARQPAWSLDDFQVVPREGLSRFHDFELPLPVMHAIGDLEFEYCTPIQAKALPDVLAGHDLVGQANTGTGKSAVFLIAILARLVAGSEKRGEPGKPRALVIAPTRELVVQIAKDGQKLGRYCGVAIQAVYGGAGYDTQMSGLRDKPVDIVVATPGRLLDFINKRVVSLAGCNIMVIDEADRMLDMGFIPDVRRIISRISAKEQRQTLLFSATVNDDVKRLSYQWCVKPTYVEAEPEQVAVDTVEQRVYLVTTEEKYKVLFNLVSQRSDDRIMVFANMKSEVRRLSERLQRDGIDCLLLSGDVAQNKRESRLERFRAGKVKVLVATDVAGRGIHIEGITYVINYTLPYEPEDYVHRIGRTGRAGAAGVSVSFACEEGAFYLPAIEEYIGRELECVPPPEELLAPVPQRAPKAASAKKSRAGRRRRRRRPAAGGGEKKSGE